MAAKVESLSNNFLNELYSSCFSNREIFECVIQHMKYNYIPNELKGYKKILKVFDTYYHANEKIPTVGIVAQTCNDEEVTKILASINKIEKVPEKDEILRSLTKYIQRVQFTELHLQLVDLYNNDKQEEAIQTQATESAKIVNFSLHQDTGYFEDVFGGFYERNEKRFIDQQTRVVSEKISFGIDFLDAKTLGGPDKREGDTTLWLARSGAGKTKCLRWLGISAARRGYDVLHIQAEGTKKEALDGYDTTWTGVYKSEFIDINEKVSVKIQRVIEDVRKKGGRIVVAAFEQFNTVTMVDVRNMVLDYKKLYGKYPDRLILDYLGLVDPGDGRKYSGGFEGEKLRKENAARKFRNICNEFKIDGQTADQVDNISPAEYNKPEFVITRNNCNLAKGLPESFSFVFSLNVTNTEYQNNEMRIHADKVRQHKGSFTFSIKTNYDRDRFYDRAGTMESFPKYYNR